MTTDRSGTNEADEAATSDSRLEPELDTDPFAVLGNETRLRIVDALYEETEATSPDAGVTYSELRDAANVDDKGNFNYHLGILSEQFVDKIDGDYRLAFAGFEVAKTIRVGAWTDHEPRGPVEVESASPLVDGAPLYASYRDSLLSVHAEDETPIFQMAVRPVGAATREMDELVETMAGLLENAVSQTRRGICPYCHCRPEQSASVVESGRWRYCFEAVCPECGPLFRVPVGAAIVRHPAVVSWYWNRGVDVRSERLWRLSVFGDDAVSDHETEPFGLRVTLGDDDDSLAVVLDETASVVSVSTPTDE
ncbi:hypothetical protein AUR64_02995 [Haloprofundus marisrubri]|uniref:ArsR family transcriptional regulator n=1 Tax=Haloprofundus marisrubri TaxID=1514971 RepID=A0A0W1R2U9_9EURY|nr:helix-turn-helix domain-containing protein [Haloprofundus marisrubri]KTG07640.1 hypothetical protein AUR64_02995 [Haloprofundus marisrubri]